MADKDNAASNTQMVTIGQLLVQAVNSLGLIIDAKFPDWQPAPANSTASGVAGQVAYSGSASTTAYLFVCLSNNQWGRVQLTTSF